MVPRGLEPRTLRLLAVRSNQLSYETDVKEVVEYSRRSLLLLCSLAVARGQSLLLAGIVLSGCFVFPVRVALALVPDVSSQAACCSTGRAQPFGKLT